MDTKTINVDDQLSQPPFFGGELFSFSGCTPCFEEKSNLKQMHCIFLRGVPEKKKSCIAWVGGIIMTPVGLEIVKTTLGDRPIGSK